MDALDRILASDNLVSVLGREVRVRVLEISGSGCLFESRSRVPLGGAGSLVVTIDACEYSDDIRIVRCQELEGSSAGFRVGAEFLWTTRPAELSLRRIVNRLHAAVVMTEAY